MELGPVRNWLPVRNKVSDGGDVERKEAGSGCLVCGRQGRRQAVCCSAIVELRESAAMSSSYEKVRGGKLSFKGGLGPEKTLDKKKHKKKKLKKDAMPEGDADEAAVEATVESTGDKEKEEKEAKAVDAIDTGTGHAPDGKKSKKYEELFPVETRRFGYVIPKAKSREAALDERVKKKADRYCK